MQPSLSLICHRPVDSGEWALRRLPRLHACSPELRRGVRALIDQMAARRDVETCLARAMAVGRGRGGGETVVRARVQEGIGRAQQLAILAADHERAMMRAMHCSDRLIPMVGRLGRGKVADAEAEMVRVMATEEVDRMAALVERYPDDRYRLDRLLRRWLTLSPSRAA